MNEPFNLPVNYQGETQEFQARFERWGYTHRFTVLIGETTVNFEPDEEGSYRAFASDQGEQPEAGLLQAIVDKLKTLS